jgi:hypothetical protein
LFKRFAFLFKRGGREGAALNTVGAEAAKPNFGRVAFCLNALLFV